MLCGTPVAAMRLGAVPEIVDEGVTGCCADSPDEFSQAIANSLALDRQSIRQRAERRFSAGEMARAYARVYQEIVAR
jgi:glycosyltransferase involved in cell wall biosynthesis